MLSPKKELGQNFLKNEFAIDLMVKSLDLSEREKSESEKETVIEIGPGMGAVTTRLLEEKVSKIYAIEFDERMVSFLKNTFQKEKALEIIHTNVLDWLPKFETDGNFKIVGSLPYYITSPILHRIVYMQKRPRVCVLLVQKEVAQKLCEKAPKASYLSTFIQTFFEVDFIQKVQKEDFEPIPKVDGGIIKLTRKEITLDYERIEKYEKFLHHAFRHPRKMLNKTFSTQILKEVGIEPTARPQSVSKRTWLELFKM